MPFLIMEQVHQRVHLSAGQSQREACGGLDDVLPHPPPGGGHPTDLPTGRRKFSYL